MMRFTKMKVCLLKLFLMSGNNQYARALLCDLLVFTHQQGFRHPIFQLLLADPHCFNEEPGEISLSVLARLNLGMTDKRSLKTMQNRYRLSKASMLIAHYLNPRMQKRLIPHRTKKYNIDPHGTEVKTTTSFFEKLINACLVNQHQMVEIRARKSIARRTDMNSSLMKASVLPKRKWWIEGEVNGKFDQQIEHIKTKWLTEEYCRFSLPWFEATFVSQVRERKSNGQEWRELFDVVPEALTSESSDNGDDDVNGPGVQISSSDESEHNESDDDGSESDSYQVGLGNAGFGQPSPVLGGTPAEMSESENAEDEESSADSSEGRERVKGLCLLNARRGSGQLKRPRSESSKQRSQRKEQEEKALNLSQARNRRRRDDERGFYTLVQKYGRQGEQ